MKIDKKEIKPISNILGLAVLDSQRLEYGLAFMMLLANHEFNLKNSNHDKLIDDYMLNLSKETLGRLIVKLKSLIKLSDGFENKLQDALDARNFLIHRFLNEADEKILTVQGRTELLQLVKEKRKTLYECYLFLDPFVHALAELRGMNMNMFTEELANKYEPD